ncbi:hypothetical protein [Zoogloea sp.]|uniref:hypothetical protein n=1 Tax=Zoogloea sp. TaxID=49181 RepID=UPI0035B3D8E6
MTNINTTRIDRLHAIWQRRTARFREAHYAPRLADEHCDRVGRNHPTYKQARELVQRALRRMEIINRQTMRLARLQIAAAGIAASVAAPALADEWTDTQVTKALALATLTAADWAQTRNIARHPVRWHENNPLLGEHPSTGAVDRHFIAGALIGAVVLDALPTPYRDWALNAGLVLEAGCVANNLRLGIGIKF